MSKGHDRTASTELVLDEAIGLHVRPASLLAQTAARYEADVSIETSDGRCVSAKSVLELLSLGLSTGQSVTITAKGPDAQEALRAIEELVKGGFRAEG